MTINQRLRAAGYTGKFDTDELLEACINCLKERDNGKGLVRVVVDVASAGTVEVEGIYYLDAWKIQRHLSNSPRDALAELYCAIKEAE